MSDAYQHNIDSDAVKFIQITDPHLFEDESSVLLGMNTSDSFSQVLKEVVADTFPYECVLATGDLVQDRAKKSYERFCQQIKSLNKPIFWTTGNHDYLPDMHEVLGQYPDYIFPHKHILMGKHWQVLLLDSQVYGVPYGRLSPCQLAWLDQKLYQNPERYTLVVFHHHIISTDSAWLDQHNLRNVYDLLTILQKYPNVKGILGGHIHQSMDKMWEGYRVMSTPSTCIQFKPANHKFKLDELQPGWREVTLHANGDIETQVKRVQHKTFLPNLLGEGY